MRPNLGDQSTIHLNAKNQAEEVNMTLERLSPAQKFNGTLAHFKTQIEGEKAVYHYGYHSIFEAIKKEKNRKLGIVEEEEIFDEDDLYEDEEHTFEYEEKLEHSYL
jgi:hypothetical protein